MDSPIWAALSAAERSAVDELIRRDHRLPAAVRMREAFPAEPRPGLYETLDVVAERYRELGVSFERRPTLPLDLTTLTEQVEALPGRTVIVGAGPVGVTAALLLARHGVRSVVLERHQDVYPLPRAVATDDEVRRILQAAGVDEEFDAIARPARGLRLLDARHRVMAEFPRAAQGAHGFPQTSMFDQPALERVLRAALARAPECELRQGVEVTGVEQSGAGPVQVTYRRAKGDHVLLAAAVLGCDGAGSVTRAAVGSRWEDLRFEERWTVIDVRTSLPVHCWEGVDQVCDPARPATFMRIGEDRYRWEFRLPDDARLDHERLRELVAPWVDLSPGADFEVVRQAQYTFRARTADRWRSGRVFLLGDAAHLTPPFIRHENSTDHLCRRPCRRRVVQRVAREPGPGRDCSS